MMLPCRSVSPLLYWPYERPYQNRWSSKGAVHQEGKSYHHGCQHEVPWWSTSREQSTRGHCLGQATAVAQKLSPPNDWAWAEPPNWKQLWTTLPESSTSSRELISCGCKQGCRGQCKCNKAALKCTALFQCCGQDLRFSFLKCMLYHQRLLSGWVESFKHHRLCFITMITQNTMRPQCSFGSHFEKNGC